MNYLITNIALTGRTTKSVRTKDIEEERRIAFVEISRAMKLPFMSHATTRMGRSVKQSPFLDEILGNK